MKIFHKKKASTADGGQEKNLRFLIVRFSSIGDIVLTTPVIRNLRKRFPDATIDYLTKDKFSSLVAANPYLDNILILKSVFKDTVREIAENDYDHIIDLHRNARTLRLKNALRHIPFHSFHKLNIKKWIYTSFKINTLPPVHIVDRYMQTITGFGAMNDGLGLDFFIPENEKIKEGDLPFSHTHGYIAIAIGAAHNTKKLPVDKLQELVSKIAFPIILLGGREDAENGEKIAATDPVKIYNACGKFSLNESADIVRNAMLVISHDTGMMHIAAAFKKQILSVWGNTVPSFGMTPYKTSYEFKNHRLQ